MMTISIIGTGNVATVLAKKFFTANHVINCVYGRSIDAATVLANEVNAVATNNLQNINEENDFVIIATNDKSIAEVAQSFSFTKTILLHTAGSVNKNILEHSATNFGVLYPIQSLRKSMDSSVSIPFLIDGNNDFTKTKIKQLALSICDKVQFGDDDKRLKLHTAAVFACNFVNYMYLQSANFCEVNNIDFSLLQPLIEETATRLKVHHPKEVFTGPAVRRDIETMEKHLNQLSSNPAAQTLYKQISAMIMNH